MATNLPESFQLIFSDSPLCVAVIINTRSGTLEDGLLLYANPSLLNLISEWQPERFDLANVVGELCTNEQGESLFPLPMTDSEQRAVVTRIHLSSGNEKWLELRAQPTVILGEVGHFFWINDVTVTKQQELAARKDAAEADAAAQAKSNFLATMSHEIRTPLQTIFGMLELMAEEDPSTTQLEMINSAKKSANGLLGILDDILDLAKADAGKMELDYFELPLRTLVYGLIESFESKRRENNLYINAEVASEIPFVVMGDPKRLRQILTNLIGNALKFTERGGITIKVTQEITQIEKPENGFGLRFEITDTGIGMSPEVAMRLFQPFTQADNSTTRRFGGTGLGLSIAHHLVELMGGKIGVYSTEGVGSTFWFEIPTEVATENTDIKLPDLSGLTILSIEDHPKGAKEIQNSLQSMGANVVSVGTFAEGLDLTEKRPFDVAIVDYGLPDGTGTDLIKKLNKLRPFMGLILYTVYDDYEVKQICKFVGAKYLSKPASRLGLGETVKSASKQIKRTKSDGPQKLLICEDTPSVQDILRRQLKIIGVEADFAENGVAGLEAIKKDSYALIITDLHMPMLDGYGLAKQIRNQEETPEQHLPIVAMTADVQLVHQQVYLQHGFDECLLKPVSLGQIKQLLIRWGLIQEISEDQDKSTHHEEVLPTTPSINEDTILSTTLDYSNITLPEKPPVDPKMAINQFGAFDDDAKEMIHMFISMTEKQVEEIDETFKQKDWPKLKGIAHSLKGAARSACCPQLGDVAERLQNDCMSGQVPDDSYLKVKAAFENVKSTMNSF